MPVDPELSCKGCICDPLLFFSQSRQLPRKWLCNERILFRVGCCRAAPDMPALAFEATSAQLGLAQPQMPSCLLPNPPRPMLEGITSYPAFCLAVLVFLALPGPGTLALLSSTAAGGLRAGLLATLGVIGGDQVLLWLATGGIAALLGAHAMAFVALQAVGAVYLVWLGVGMLRAPSQHSVAEVRPGIRHHFRRAFLITVLNPKAIFFYLAFFPQFIDSSSASLQTFVVLAATIVVISAAYCISLCALVAKASRIIGANSSATFWLQRVLGLGLIAFGISLFRIEQLPL